MKSLSDLLSTPIVKTAPRWRSLRLVMGSLVLLVCAAVMLAPTVHAASNSNIVGIHTTQPSAGELAEIATMVNGSGGSWGYVTVVMQENNRDLSYWQGMFDIMAQRKLIPIVRIATQPQGASWRRPSKEDANAWVDFLDQLDWPIQNRYVVLFNEPNHGSEWGGSVHPEHYGEVAREFAIKLDQKNSDFFVMLAGFDSAAPAQNPAYEDQGTFINRMLNTFSVADINRYISGWASHSYPNPGFRGKPTDTGRNSIRNYEWELSVLKVKGVKDLPVFITETGWPRSSYDDATVAQYLEEAYTNVWQRDGRVRAVTPFLFTYIGAPFETWSWKKPDGSGFYSAYHTIRKMPKIPGRPTLADGQVAGVSTVYRFYSPLNRSHFFTVNSSERNQVMQRYDPTQWRYEGPAFSALTSAGEGLLPVYRFWSPQNRGHFYTISRAEKELIERTYSENEWRYEGTAFYVRSSRSATGGNVYRFWSPQNRKHFYTSSRAERDAIRRTYSENQWRYEGIAWRSTD